MTGPLQSCIGFASFFGGSDIENKVISFSGNMYLNGQAVEQNYKLALQFFQLGIKKGK